MAKWNSLTFQKKDAVSHHIVVYLAEELIKLSCIQIAQKEITKHEVVLSLPCLDGPVHGSTFKRVDDILDPVCIFRRHCIYFNSLRFSQSIVCLFKTISYVVNAKIYSVDWMDSHKERCKGQCTTSEVHHHHFLLKTFDALLYDRSQKMHFFFSVLWHPICLFKTIMLWCWCLWLFPFGICEFFFFVLLVFMFSFLGENVFYKQW